MAEGEGERIVAVYAPGFAVRVPSDGKRAIVVNATEEESVLVEDGNGVRRVLARPSSWVEL